MPSNQEPFPGTKHYPGWRFLYIQSDDIAGFSTLFDEIGDFIEESAIVAPDGSYGTTNSRLELPDGRLLFGISINGDTEFFERSIRAFSSERGLAVGVIDLPQVRLDEGTAFLFEDCGASYFDF